MKLMAAFMAIPLAVNSCEGPLTKDTVRIYLTRCPPLVTYSKEQQQRALTELRKIATDSEIARYVSDYSKLRDACRAIRNKQ